MSSYIFSYKGKKAFKAVKLREPFKFFDLSSYCHKEDEETYRFVRKPDRDPLLYNDQLIKTLLFVNYVRASTQKNEHK